MKQIFLSLLALLIVLGVFSQAGADAQTPSYKTVYVVEYRQTSSDPWLKFGEYDTQQEASLKVLFLMNQFYEARITPKQVLVQYHSLKVRAFLKGSWAAGNATWIQGAKVTLKSRIGNDVNTHKITDANGEVVFPLVKIGQYEITVEKWGYKTASRVYVMPAYDAVVNMELERQKVRWTRVPRKKTKHKIRIPRRGG